MATIQVRNLSFAYPTTTVRAIDNVSFIVNPSDFVVLCGKSGCGKSTLLRHLKKNLMPYGSLEGEVLYDGKSVAELDDRLNASEIGFVQQNPDNQIVTDQVWHELAFGLESLGLDNKTIKRRVAEMASFFDIQTWFRKNVSELSGGQKQLLNLASIMVMQPEVLILDEPTSQLDPIAASEFLKTIYRINRELGTTVIISEHRLEELFTMADKVMVMDKGKIIAYDEPWNIGGFLAGSDEEDRHPMFYGMPSVMKIYSRCRGAGVPASLRDNKEMSPLTIRDGRLWLESFLKDDAGGVYEQKSPASLQEQSKDDDMGEEVIGASDLWFKYSRNSGDVLRGLNLSVRKGELFCLLGGNGAGKSTTLKAISGLIKPQRGKIKVY